MKPVFSLQDCIRKVYNSINTLPILTIEENQEILLTDDQVGLFPELIALKGFQLVTKLCFGWTKKFLSKNVDSASAILWTIFLWGATVKTSSQLLNSLSGTLFPPLPELSLHTYTGSQL